MDELIPHVHPSLLGFARVELDAMCLAGEIQRHGVRGLEFYLPVGVIPTDIDRATSVRPLWTPGRVFVDAAARWICHGGSVPRVIDIARRSSRLPDTYGGLVRWRDRRIPPQQRVRVGGVDVVRAIAEATQAAATQRESRC